MRVSYCNKQGTCISSSNSKRAALPVLSLGTAAPNTPIIERTDVMNRNPKEKTVQILIRAKPKDKDKIKKLAAKCNLSVSEYMLQRALGYEPRTVQPDAFYDLYGKLCEVCNTDDALSEQTETALLDLIDRIHSELLLPRKEAVTWQPPASGP